jgi:DNA-binding HxlR family transcriptional regulator
MSMSDERGQRWHGLRELLGAKWTLHVLDALATDPRGFNDLQRAVDGMTATMLSRRLEELVCHGLVDRHVADTVPPTTTYRLTPQGREALTHLDDLAGLFDPADCADPRCATGADTCLTLDTGPE